MTDHENALAVASILASQSDLNQSVTRALQSVALTADRHDAEMTELRDEIAQLGVRVAQLEWNAKRDTFSRKVPS